MFEKEQEEIARWLFYFKYPVMEGESGADASVSPSWETIPQWERESYRKSAKAISQLFEANTLQIMPVVNAEDLRRIPTTPVKMRRLTDEEIMNHANEEVQHDG